MNLIYLTHFLKNTFSKYILVFGENIECCFFLLLTTVTLFSVESLFLFYIKEH